MENGWINLNMYYRILGKAKRTRLTAGERAPLTPENIKFLEEWNFDISTVPNTAEATRLKYIVEERKAQLLATPAMVCYAFYKYNYTNVEDLREEKLPNLKKWLDDKNPKKNAYKQKTVCEQKTVCKQKMFQILYRTPDGLYMTTELFNNKSDAEYVGAHIKPEFDVEVVPYNNAYFEANGTGRYFATKHSALKYASSTTFYK